MKILKIFFVSMNVTALLSGCTNEHIWGGSSKAPLNPTEKIELTDTTPLPDSVGHDLNQNLSLTFSTTAPQLTLSSLELRASSPGGSVVPLSNLQTADSKTFTFKATGLKSGTEYFLTVKSGVYNVTRLPFDGITFSFETRPFGYFDIGNKFATSYQVYTSRGGYVDYDGNPVALVTRISDDGLSLEKYDGSALTSLGGGDIAISGAIFNLSLITQFDDLNKVATPFVFYANNSNRKGSVKKLVNNQWELVGAADFTGQTLGSGTSSMALDASGNPVVAYAGFDSKLLVQRYQGGSWQYVGSSTGVTSFNVDYVTIQVLDSGDMLVVGNDKTNGAAFAMLYNGTSWANLPVTGLPSTKTYHLRSALDSLGRFNIIFMDVDNGGYIQAARFNGTSWDSLGTISTNFSNETAALIKGKDGNLYASFKDTVNSREGFIVKKYDGTSWSTVGTSFATEFSALGGCAYMQGPDGSHYVGYSEYNMVDSTNNRKLRFRKGF